MYNSILEGLYSKHNITSINDRQLYLSSLKESVREIRNAYRHFPVCFNYADPKIQAGYLLTYVPHYTDLLYSVLNSTGSHFAKEGITNLMFFGGGPCPEIVGYLRYLNEHNAIDDQNINLTIWDIAVDDWKWSRDIVFENITPKYLNGNSCKRSVGTIDISTHFNIEIDNEKHLIVFQNCLNEITQDTHNILIRNITKIFSQLPSGSHFALIDLDYWQVRNLIEIVESNLASIFDIQILRSVLDGEIQHRTTQTNEPQIILENLLTDKFGETPTGLLPKRNVKFIYSFIKKK